ISTETSSVGFGDFACLRANLDFVRRILNRRAGGRTELRIAFDVPVHGMGIEQQLHGMYSAKSFRCSSSSEMIVMNPLPRRGGGRRPGFGLRCSLTSFATGWLFSVITTSSPGDSWWIRSDSFAWAS